MFGLRQKLALGFGGLLAILLLVSGLGIAVLAQYRGALDRFMDENWRSVQYGQHMIDALDRLNDIAKPLAGGEHEPTAAELGAASSAAGKIGGTAGALNDFERNSDAENHNITLEGEDKLAAAVTRLWKGETLSGQKIQGDCYRDEYLRLLDPRTAGADRTKVYATLMRLSAQLKAQDQAILSLNLDNMKPINGRAKKMAANATRMMVLSAVIGVALAILFTLLVTRSILRALSAVTQSIREIEQGNLDLVVQVKSRDELHQLAEAFNSMAAKLREFRRTDHARLVRTQRTTQLAVDSLPDAIAIISPDGIIELSNQTAQRLFQLSPGMRISESREPRLNDTYKAVVSARRATEPRGYEAVMEVFDGGGKNKYFLPHAVPICDQDAHLLGVTLVLADVTNLRRLDEMKSGLLSVVSHELKTPLTSIRMAVHLLLEEQVGPLTSKQSELLVAARDESARLGTIIEDLLDMGRLESGHVQLDLRAEPAARLVSDAIGPLESAFQDRGVSLHIDIPAETPPVLVDLARIDHVFSNLLTNAMKFTDPGGSVHVLAETAGDMVRFVVEDTGIGIPAEYQSRIFERFFRVPRRNQPSGAGLGLAIAREIVEAHGGCMDVQSAVGHGSRFRFTLKRADQSGAVPSEEDHEAGIHSGNG